MRLIFLIFLESYTDHQGKVITNTDNSFHIGFPGAIDSIKSCSPTIVITTSHKPANVNITNYANNFHYKYTIPPNNSTVVTLDAQLVVPNVGITNRTVSIQSDRDISISIHQCKLNYLALPQKSFSKKYIVLTQVTTTARETSNFMIIASHKATEVRIQFPTDISYPRQHSPKIRELIIQLASSQGFYMESMDDLTGTMISSQHPIAVLSGNRLVDVKARTKRNLYHIAMQMPGTQYWGQTYLLPSVQANTGHDRFRILAAYNHTAVFVQFIHHSITLSTGMAIDVDTSYDFSILLTCDKPCLVVYAGKLNVTTKTITNSLMIIVPSFGQYLQNYTFTTISYPTWEDHYFNTGLRQDNYKQLLVDGKIVKLNNTTSPIMTPYKMVWAKVSVGFHRIQVVPVNEFFGLFIFNNDDDHKDYFLQGYLAGIRLYPILNVAYDRK